MWGALSDERIDVLFTIAPGSLQSSHFQVRVPRDSWPYFKISDSRHPFPSPPTTPSVTVEIFNPTSTRDSQPCPSPSPSHIATDGQSVSQSVSKSWCRAPSGAHDQMFITVERYGFVFCGTSSLTRGRVFFTCYWPLPAQSFLGPSPLGLATVFYCLRFDTSFFHTQTGKIPRYAASGWTQQKTLPLTSLHCCYGRLPSNSSDIVAVFTCRYEETHVPFHDRCVATVLHVKYCSLSQYSYKSDAFPFQNTKFLTALP
jgi:hypothetical protein